MPLTLPIAYRLAGSTLVAKDNPLTAQSKKKKRVWDLREKGWLYGLWLGGTWKFQMPCSETKQNVG